MLALLGPLSALLGHEAASVKARLMRQAALYGTLAVLGVVAIVFLLTALNTALTYAVGPLFSPLIIAGGAALVGLVLFLVFHLINAAEARREAEKARSSEMTALVTTAALTAIPMLLPVIRKIGLPASGAAAAAIFSLLQAKSLRRDED